MDIMAYHGCIMYWATIDSFNGHIGGLSFNANIHCSSLSGERAAYLCMSVPTMYSINVPQPMNTYTAQ